MICFQLLSHTIRWDGTQFIIRPLTTTHFRLYATSTFEGSIDNVIVQELPASIDRKYYLDTDGSDDWMEVKPTLNLGEQWWHVGAWQSDTTGARPFATSSAFQGAPRHLSGRIGFGMMPQVSPKPFARLIRSPSTSLPLSSRTQTASLHGTMVSLRLTR